MVSKIKNNTEYKIEDKAKENQMLETDDSQKTLIKSDRGIIAKPQPDFSSFQVNNWKRRNN